MDTNKFGCILKHTYLNALSNASQQIAKITAIIAVIIAKNDH